MESARNCFAKTVSPSRQLTCLPYLSSPNCSLMTRLPHTTMAKAEKRSGRPVLHMPRLYLASTCSLSVFTWSRTPAAKIWASVKSHGLSTAISSSSGIRAPGISPSSFEPLLARRSIIWRSRLRSTCCAAARPNCSGSSRLTRRVHMACALLVFCWSSRRKRRRCCCSSSSRCILEVCTTCCRKPRSSDLSSPLWPIRSVCSMANCSPTKSSSTDVTSRFHSARVACRLLSMRVQTPCTP
mmetsp:Transcript_34230/g.58570  ORF Transcript_34230/g.58570 Transcript_34230/m.58570 type:complete len:240 (+) Transcript_34230:905-1624(+)